ncbi:probable protein phosphatase 2C 74 isoform X1 [Musa acuminata AAA Group]|uniref:probable protein phosphatase 2C 74 isoform X1 n=1 Tax=Musa acuminata AAA Group TaxID=214697 RepID=UPI0031DB426A
MVDLAEFLCSLLCSLAYLRLAVRKYFLVMAPGRASPAPHSSWKRPAELAAVANKRSKESSDLRARPVEDVVPGGSKPAGTFVEQVSSLPKQESVECEEKSGHSMVEVAEKKMPRMRRRPARIAIPKPSADAAFGVADKEEDGVERELAVEGGEYCVVSRKGQRHMMEDGYAVIPNIHGDSKQAFFGVFDGHGGRAAVDFVSEKLGKNIVAALDEPEKKENQAEMAIKAGYLTTDRDFLSQGVRSGACAATVLLRDGELHVANVGDCRVVMSRKGVADALTDDHRAGREDERNRIENSGGYVTCRNGIWRVNDSLAVSRAIGDLNMKEWIISEPETKSLQLTPDCEFLILGSDGLWDKVGNQEAVDVVSRQSNAMKSCRDLIEVSCGRGNRDDITVMVIDLQKFIQLRGS